MAHVGPDPDGPGGMPAAMRALLASPLGERYRLEAIATHRTAGVAGRLARFAGGTASLVVWSLRRGTRIVHIHATVRGSLHRKALLVFTARALRRPVVLHMHSGPGDLRTFGERLGRGRRRVFARAFAAADRVLSVSAASAAELERIFGARDVVIVPNAIAAPAPTGGAAAGDGSVVFLGGFANPVKGGDVMVEALPALLEAAPGATVTLAGPGEPPPAARALLGNGRVAWKGYLDEAAKHAALAGAAVFVLPSTSEGLPMALLEAMAHGRPVVATRVGGVPDIVSDGRDGVLVEPGDPGALAAAVAGLLADPERAAKLGAAARGRVAEMSPERVAERMDAIYREVLAGAA